MIVRSEFRPARGFGNRHWQTLLPALGLVDTPSPTTRREILSLPDGDSLALDWLASDAASEAPLLVILHGLEGSSESSYAKGLMAEAASRNWQAVVMHFRDCGDHRNRLSRRYHAGETGDIEYLARELQTRLPTTPLFYAGFSLGANVLLKHLGESSDQARCIAAVGVSVPFELQMASDSISKGFSRLYQWHLMRNMKKALRRKFEPATAPFDFDAAMQTKTFESFDDLVTAPLHGFAGKDDYYSSSSSRQFLKKITRPTLVIHAKDDPFMNTDMIPTSEELSSSVVLELSDKGGHVGFIEGELPWRLRYWLPKRIAHFLNVQYENGLRSR